MTPNVQPSPANAAASKERSAAPKGVTAQRFDEMVSEKASSGGRTQKAGTSSSRGLMPGQIAGHQDTVVSLRDGGANFKAEPVSKAELAAKAELSAKTAIGKTEKESSTPWANAYAGTDPTDKPKMVGVQGEKLEAPQELSRHAEEDSERGDGSLSQTENQLLPENSQQESAPNEGEQQESGHPQPDSVDQHGAVEAAGEATSEAVSSAQGPVADVAVPAGPAAAAVAGVGVQAPVSAPNAAGASSAVPVAVSLDSPGGSPAAGVLPGMGHYVSALAEHLSAQAKTGEVKGEGTFEGKTASAPQALPIDPPNLRGSVFTQMLSDFAGEHGFAPPPDLLTGFDRPVAAAAQANRAPDVQRPTPLQMLPIEIGMQAVRGAREFQIRLDPAELGRVDVKLQINDKGEVNASLVVERPETLQMLRRDATTLAQAFEQAGLKQGENALSFSLKGEHQQGQQHQSQGRNASVPDSEDAALQAQIGEIAMRRVMIPNSSLDRMV